MGQQIGRAHLVHKLLVQDPASFLRETLTFHKKALGAEPCTEGKAGNNSHKFSHNVMVAFRGRSAEDGPTRISNAPLSSVKRCDERL